MIWMEMGQDKCWVEAGHFCFGQGISKISVQNCSASLSIYMNILIAQITRLIDISFEQTHIRYMIWTEHDLHMAYP